MPIAIDDLVNLYPTVFHITELSALASIEKLGLLSTTAALDKFGIAQDRRHQLESRIRRESAVIAKPGFGKVVVRDQKPLSAKKLEGCLEDGLTVTEWLNLINRKVFFWVDREKAESLIKASEYRARKHLVFEVDTRSIVTAHQHSVTLASMNTGTTNPFAHPRGRTTIAPLAEFPYAERNRRELRIAVELCVDYSVPDFLDHIRAIYIGSAEGGLQPCEF